MKLKIFLARILVIALGMAAGILFVEGGMRLLKGTPPPLRAGEDFAWAYVDIYRPFFAKDVQRGICVSRRPRSNDVRFSITKAKDEKRIFIVGESVAFLYDGKTLETKFRNILPAYDWNVINCGMSGYDSYRIYLVAKEIVRYQPDLVVLMMGNNEGSHNPVRINSWLYTWPFLSRSWVTRLVTGFVNPTKYVAERDVNRYFGENARAIAQLGARYKVPVVVCTMPINHMVPYEAGQEKWQDKTVFSLFWLTEKYPREAIRLLAGLNGYNKSSSYFAARSYEKIGDTDTADKFYCTNTSVPREKRNEIIRKMAQEKTGDVVLADLDRRLAQITRGRSGFEYFWDEMHYWPPVYALISDEIVNALSRSGCSYPLVQEIRNATRHNGYPDVDTAELIRENRAVLTDHYYFMFGGRILNDSREEYANELSVLKGWYRIKPEMIEDSRNARDKILAWVHSTKEEEWSRWLALAGEVLREDGKTSAALAYFDDAVKADGGNAYAYLFRGLCHYDMHQKELAERDFAELHRIKPAFGWLSVTYLRSLEPKRSAATGQ